MKIAAPFRCDYCKCLKTARDLWFLRPIDAIGFYVMRWDEELASQPGYEHICSQNCALRAFDRWANVHAAQCTETPASL